MTDDALEDFTADTFVHGGKEHRVLRSGTGPAVIVIAEFPRDHPGGRPVRPAGA